MVKEMVEEKKVLLGVATFSSMMLNKEVVGVDGFIQTNKTLKGLASKAYPEEDLQDEVMNLINNDTNYIQDALMALHLSDVVKLDEKTLLRMYYYLTPDNDCLVEIDEKDYEEMFGNVSAENKKAVDVVMMMLGLRSSETRKEIELFLEIASSMKIAQEENKI